MVENREAENLVIGCVRIPVNLTRRHCVGKVAEVYDLLCKVMPIIAPMKLDLRTLVQRKLSWDGKIPFDLRETWESNFKKIQYQRAMKLFHRTHF